MKIQRRFAPSSNLELVEDYAYMILDEVTTTQRKQLKLRLAVEGVLQVFPKTIDLLLFECDRRPTKTLLILGQVPDADVDSIFSSLRYFDHRFMTDNELEQFLDAAHRSQSLIQSRLQAQDPACARLYAVRLHQAQLRHGLNHARLSALDNYIVDEGCQEDAWLPEVLHLQRQLKQQQESLARDGYTKALVGQLEKQLKQDTSKVAPTQQATPCMAIQRFGGEFCRKSLETLELKSQTQASPPIAMPATPDLVYFPVNPSTELCDDPTKPWFYANDPRETYPKPQEKQPYGRLIIRGNSVAQPSCVLQDQAFAEVCDELARRYDTQEEFMKRATLALASGIWQELQIQISLGEDIRQETQRLQTQQGRPSSDFYSPSTQLDPAEAFILENSAMLEAIRFDWRVLPQHGPYKQQIYGAANGEKKNHAAVTIIETLMKAPKIRAAEKLLDLDELLLLSPRERAFEDPITVHLPGKEPMIIAKSHLRFRTTYELLRLWAQMAWNLQWKPGQQFPGVKREASHLLVFNSRLSLRGVFIGLEALGRDSARPQLEAIRQVFQQKREFTLKEFAEITRNLRETTSRDKYSSVKIQEDAGPGDCAVCGVHYENYKTHVFDSTHTRNYRQQMDGQCFKQLQALQQKFQRKEAITTQLQLQAQTVSSHAGDWQEAARAINECARAVGLEVQIDEHDPPRAGSPTVKSKQFQVWADCVHARRAALLEAQLQQSQARTSAYKRSKAAAPTMALQLNTLYRAQERAGFVPLPPSHEPEQTTLTRIVPVPEPLFRFAEQGHHRLIQIAMVTVLARRAQGIPILVSPGVHCDFLVSDVKAKTKEEPQSEEFDALIRALRDSAPEVPVEPYLEDLAQKRTAQETVTANVNDLDENPSLDVLPVDFLALSRDLELTEIGFLPETDQLIQLACALMGIECGHRISAKELLQEAEAALINKQLTVLEPAVAKALEDFLYRGETQTPATLRARDAAPRGAQLRIGQGRLKLPLFYPAPQAAPAADTRLPDVKQQRNPHSSAARDARIVEALCGAGYSKFFSGLLSQLNAKCLGKTADQDIADQKLKKETMEEEMEESKRAASAPGRLKCLFPRKKTIVRANSFCSLMDPLGMGSISRALLQPREQTLLLAHPSKSPEYMGVLLATRSDQWFSADSKDKEPGDSTMAVSNQPDTNPKGPLAVVRPIHTPVQGPEWWKPAGYVKPTGRKEPFDAAVSHSQINASYALQIAATGLTGELLHAAAAFREAAADAFLGTGASISSVQNDESSWSLKGADVYSITLLGVASRAKIGLWRDGSEARQLEVSRKTVQRAVPQSLSMGDIYCEVDDAEALSDPDVDVIRNTRLVPVIGDVLIGAIYQREKDE